MTEVWTCCVCIAGTQWTSILTSLWWTRMLSGILLSRAKPGVTSRPSLRRGSYLFSSCPSFLIYHVPPAALKLAFTILHRWIEQSPTLQKHDTQFSMYNNNNNLVFYAQSTIAVISGRIQYVEIIHETEYSSTIHEHLFAHFVICVSYWMCLNHHCFVSRVTGNLARWCTIVRLDTVWKV